MKIHCKLNSNHVYRAGQKTTKWVSKPFIPFYQYKYTLQNLKIHGTLWYFLEY